MTDARGLVYDNSGHAGSGASYVLDDHKSVDTYIDETRAARKRLDDESEFDTKTAAPPDVFRIAAPWDGVELQADLEKTWYDAAKPIVLNKFKTPEEKAAARLNLELTKASILKKAYKSSEHNSPHNQKMMALYTQDPDLFPDNSGEALVKWMATPIDQRGEFPLKPLADNDWIKDIQRQEIKWGTDTKTTPNADGSYNTKGQTIWDESKVKSAYETWVMQNNKAYRSMYKNALGLSQSAFPTASPEQQIEIANKKVYEQFRNIKKNQFALNTRNTDRAPYGGNSYGSGRSIKIGKYLWTPDEYIDNDGTTVKRYTLSDPVNAGSELPVSEWVTNVNEVKEGGVSKNAPEYTKGYVQGIVVKNGETLVNIKTVAPKGDDMFSMAMQKEQTNILVPIDIFNKNNKIKIESEYLMGATVEEMMQKADKSGGAINSPTKPNVRGTEASSKDKWNKNKRKR